uniref:Vps72/YL1 C-terminal domain-containing protein n=1 Tax=Odontella aurita TaxID=265563 RepID=A0A7S4JFP3_9STRA|mmetsp:Transcript_45750/g.139009  ORF Transcript_45750/g.139009 Transcript_45750/m.139009 type:complete len:225 (+) Transcript_45750:100-774(+)|eukprot:CAMPEP_0113531386 /NCGR_PEP_ID=MMETSP0015_2-20120614/3468_1 /TAXON_ID=2838 /ORGANISM="Odontella" /LENGTH=224 /DNA_ID=CAMNT_0000430217 /DNA_START=97 /DNA_END=771 /DNA_ORIENTATION=+ /assembly_acc=CAM_ASM_000160
MGGSANESQRKAWNEMMRGAGHPAMAAAGSRLNTRRSDRKKQARREKARKSTVDASSDGLEGRRYRAAVRIDALEGVADDQNGFEEDEEFDELDEVEGGGSSSAVAKRKRKGAASGATKVGVLPKRLRPRSLASILIEESGRVDGTTQSYLDAESRPPMAGRRHPSRKFCPVTGLFGIYTDPKSGIPFANLKALEQIRERAPPWMTLGGSAAYSEAVKSLKNEE